MIGPVCVIGVCLIVAAMLIYGALCRIAECIAAQNEHYGIGLERPTEPTERLRIVNKDGDE